MSSEPNKPMDRPLAAYAEKRRQDAGAPLELHPATRQLLQSEAARKHAGARTPGSHWAGLLTAWWPRLAAASILAAFLGLISWALFQPQELRERQSMAQVSRDEVLLAEQLKSDAPPAEGRALGTSLDGRDTLVSSPPILPTEARGEAASAMNPFEKVVAIDEAERLRREIAKLEKRVTEEKSALPRSVAVNSTELRERPDAKPTQVARFARGDAAPPAASLPTPAPVPGTLKTKQVSLSPGTETPRRQSAASQQNLGVAYSAATAAQKPVAGVAPEPAAAPAVRGLAPTATGLGGARTVNPPIQPPPAPTPAAPRNRELTDLAATSTRGADPVERGDRFAAPTEATNALPRQQVYFRQWSAGTSTGSDALKAPQLTDLLTSFSWEQSGTKLRVVDADGSVYSGELQGAVARASSPSSAELRLKPGADDQLNFRRTLGSTSEVAEIFQISGTNRTLRQRLAIEGQVWREAQSSAVPGAVGGLGGKPVIPPAGGPAVDSPVAGRFLRIEARATLSDGRVVPVQAISK